MLCDARLAGHQGLARLAANFEVAMGLGGEADIQSILQMEATKVISRWTTYQELMRRGFFGPNFDPKLEAQRIALETLAPVDNDGDGIDDVTGLPIREPVSTDESSHLQ